MGCGKTIVAFLALLAAAGSGYQGALMAPTEILAEQHFANLQRLLGQMAAAGGAGVCVSVCGVLGRAGGWVGGLGCGGQ